MRERETRSSREGRGEGMVPLQWAGRTMLAGQRGLSGLGGGIERIGAGPERPRGTKATGCG